MTDDLPGMLESPKQVLLGQDYSYKFEGYNALKDFVGGATAINQYMDDAPKSLVEISVWQNDADPTDRHFVMKFNDLNIMTNRYEPRFYRTDYVSWWFQNGTLNW